MGLNELIRLSVEESVVATSYLGTPEGVSFIESVAHLLARTFSSGHKVLIAGNGGSLCDAAHFAEELTGQFRKARMALPAIVLSEPGHLTCVGNDFGFDEVYRRGVQAFGLAGDVFIALTTSGNSPNILVALEEATRRKLHTVCLLGKGGGKVKDCADYQLIIPYCSTSDRVQEAHMACLHIIIEAVEAILFPPIDNETHDVNLAGALPCALGH
jgi:D-sedoheptulose 7-phosphate isomerase